MEELLKAYAQQRREKAGAPFELHSVSRRLLLDEAARIAGPPQPIKNSRLQRWRRFLPRLAFAGAVAVLAAGLVWILIPGKSQKMQLSQTAPTPAQPPMPAAAPTHDRQAPLEAVMNRNASSAKKKETLAARPETLNMASKAAAPGNAPAPSQPEVQAQPDTTSSQRQLYVVQDAARPAVSLDLKNEAERTPAASAGANQELRLAGGGGGNEASQLREEAKARLDTRVNAPAPARPAAPAAVPVSGLAGAFGEAASTPPGGGGAAAEIPATEKGLTPPRWRSQQAAAGRVLNVFELERAGSRVRIIDADGSVYAGELVAGPEAARIGQRFLPAEPQSSRRLTGPLLKQQPILEKARGGAASHPAAEYAAFRATGTNRTLNLPVVIEAVFVTMAGNGAVNAPADKLAAPSSSPAPGASFAQPANPAGLKPAEQTSWSSMAATTKIQGTVRIGRTNQMALDARPEER